MDTELDSCALSGRPEDVDGSDWPRIKLHRLRLLNFGRHANLEIDFRGNPDAMRMVCIVGENGAGKTTILHAIQLLFGNYVAYNKERYLDLMLRNVRNYQNLRPSEVEGADFHVEGWFVEGGREYSVFVSRCHGFGSHPPAIQKRLGHYCFATRYDLELDRFQLRRSHWPRFSQLFSAVTGFKVQEEQSNFSLSRDRHLNALLTQYVLDFRIDKGAEIIRQRQCSAGEKKIIKCFSTILNKPVMPCLILIDNVTDHVELSRHLAVLDNIEQCFPESQVITTCHSAPVQSHLPRRNRLIDMRLLAASEMVRRQPWRLRLLDEAHEWLQKLLNLHGTPPEEVAPLLSGGYWLQEQLQQAEGEPLDLARKTAAFVSNSSHLVCQNYLNTPMPIVRTGP